jgi:hypothetical protein
MFEYEIKHGKKTWVEVAPNKLTLLDTLNDEKIFKPTIKLLGRVNEPETNTRRTDQRTQTGIPNGQTSRSAGNSPRDFGLTTRRKHSTPENEDIVEVAGSLADSETLEITAGELYVVVGDSIDLGRQIKTDFIVSLIDKQLQATRERLPKTNLRWVKRITKVSLWGQIKALLELRGEILGETE